MCEACNIQSFLQWYPQDEEQVNNAGLQHGANGLQFQCFFMPLLDNKQQKDDGQSSREIMWTTWNKGPRWKSNRTCFDYMVTTLNPLVTRTLLIYFKVLIYSENHVLLYFCYSVWLLMGLNTCIPLSFRRRSNQWCESELFIIFFGHLGPVK